jgi:para-aminobenzoate synthetase component I
VNGDSRPTSPAALAEHLTAGPVTLAPLTVAPRDESDRVDVLRCAAALGGTLLESAPGAPGTGRFSYVVAAAAGRLIHDGGAATLRLGDLEYDLGADALDAVDAVAAAMGCTPTAARPLDAPPFAGGLVGAFAYDLARQIERIPTIASSDRATGWLDLVLATAVLAIDHADESAVLVTRPLAGLPVPDPADIADRLRTAPPVAVPAPRRRPVATTLPPARYHAAVRRVLDHIAAGDVFQVNVTQRLTTTWEGGAAALYGALRRSSPAPHGALHVCHDGSAVASISPETFLTVTGTDVVTRPIKGTRPRSDDPAEDQRLRDELIASGKDRAENVMVVDMERNDLGRVCLTSSVTVPDLLTAEPHPTVWQLVSTVQGRLRDDVGYGTLLRATFPSGSVTGTPKVRAMQLIEELEPVRRGWYCGSIGFLAPGAASLSVAIRTAVLAGDQVDYAAGGGVVAESDPVAEHEESLAKAAAFLSAVTVP